jgi:hypothetical protein
MRMSRSYILRYLDDNPSVHETTAWVEKALVICVAFFGTNCLGTSKKLLCYVCPPQRNKNPIYTTNPSIVPQGVCLPAHFSHQLCCLCISLLSYMSSHWTSPIICNASLPRPVKVLEESCKSWGGPTYTSLPKVFDLIQSRMTSVRFLHEKHMLTYALRQNT